MNSKIETVCPHCKKTNTVEKNHFGVGKHAHGLQKVQCSHCSKGWETDLDLDVTGSLAKSAPVPSSELAALRVQIRAQLNELTKRVNGLIESRAKFNTNGREVEKSDEVNREFLNKALENGKPFTFQTSEGSSPRFQRVESVESGRRVRSGAAFDTNGIEKSDVADQELQKALANGKPVGFTPRGN